MGDAQLLRHLLGIGARREGVRAGGVGPGRRLRLGVQ